MIHLFPVVKTKAAIPFGKSFLGAKGKKTISVFSDIMRRLGISNFIDTLCFLW